MRAISEPQDMLGESPVWSARDRALYWVDIRGPSLCRWRPQGDVTRWPMPEPVGAVMLRRSGGVIVGLPHGLSALDLETGRLSSLCPLDDFQPGHRINDSRCDPKGRAWFSTMRDPERAPTGRLYCLDPDGGLIETLSGLTVPNALGFTADGGRLYVADSSLGAIEALDLAPDGPRPVARRILVPAGTAPGKPDGLAVDQEGHLWSARYGGGAIARFTPDGALVGVIPLPVTNPTSCCFGGPDLATLFVTTARQGLDPARLAAEPLAGAVLAFDPGARGRAEPEYRG